MNRGKGEGSFALVSTLLIVAVMALGSLAFFQASQLDRLVSRNTADRIRAELAAQSGLAAAGALLRSLSSNNDHFLVVLNPTNRQLFLGNGSNQPAGTFAYQPLFSSTSNLTNLLVTTSTAGLPSFATNATTTNLFTNTLPGGLAQTSPLVAWVQITNAAGQTNARFAFWVEDLAGRLDLSVAGSTGTNATRPTGTNPAELALWSLFNAATNLDSTNATVQSLVSARTSLLTPATARLVSPLVTTNLLADLATGLIHDTNEPEIVPYGFGYADQGQPKLNLNQAITNTGALDLIAAEITGNLPGFTSRAGGMNGQAYVYALAANIIDYADANDDATSTNVNGIRIQGFDNYPYLTHLFDSLLYQSNNPTLTITTYLQFWNLSSRTNLSNSVTFTYRFNDTVWYPTNTLSPSNSIVTNRIAAAAFTTNFSLPGIPPNSGFIAAVTNTVNLTSLPGFPNPGWTEVKFNVPAVWALTPSDQETQTNSFSITWGVTTLSNAIGFARINRDFPSGTARAMGSVFGMRLWFGNTLTNPTDPRMLPYLNAGTSSSYDDFSGESTVWRDFPRATNTNHSGNPALWLEGKGSAFASNGPSALTNPILTSLPGSFSIFPNSPPALLSSNNLYASVTELGRIFDPIQWRPSPFPGTNDFANLDITTNWAADNQYGGGSTLRIGRPEHSRFTNNGTRAAQLLDLFAVGERTTNGGATVLNSVAGRINLNTATTNTLRALAAGVLHTNDPALVSAGSAQGTNFVIPSNAVSAFVRAVTNARNLRPFASPNQLTLLTNNTVGASWPNNAVFGNGSAAGVGGVMGASGPISWTDAAAEEWFSKVYPLCTVRSRNFLVYVVGQTLRTNSGRPLATVKNLYQVYLAPERGADGLTTNSRIQIVRSWSLP